MKGKMITLKMLKMFLKLNKEINNKLMKRKNNLKIMQILQYILQNQMDQHLCMNALHLEAR